MFRIITMLDSNGKFVPVLNLGKQYWAAEELENGSQKLYHLTKEYLKENSTQFGNVKILKSGKVSVAPVFCFLDFNVFDVHFNKGYERYRNMPDRKQTKLFQEYANNVDLGDILNEKYPLLMKELIKHRGDFFVSDREIAALAYAVRNMVF